MSLCRPVTPITHTHTHTHTHTQTTDVYTHALTRTHTHTHTHTHAHTCTRASAPSSKTTVPFNGTSSGIGLSPSLCRLRRMSSLSSKRAHHKYLERRARAFAAAAAPPIATATAAVCPVAPHTPTLSPSTQRGDTTREHGCTGASAAKSRPRSPKPRGAARKTPAEMSSTFLPKTRAVRARGNTPLARMKATAAVGTGSDRTADFGQRLGERLQRRLGLVLPALRLLSRLRHADADRGPLPPALWATHLPFYWQLCYATCPCIARSHAPASPPHPRACGQPRRQQELYLSRAAAPSS